MRWRHIGGVKTDSGSFLTSELHVGKCSASRCSPFITGDRVPGTNWAESWVNPRAVRDVRGKRKITYPSRD
jgi:hypothetical protein